MISGEVLERFWSKIKRGGADECREWQGRRDKNGYGRFGHDGSSHRIAYSISTGAIPHGFEIRHKCDNPRCCNPAHLELGTHADNMKDMKERCSTAGENNPRAILNEEKVREIKALRASGTGSRELVTRLPHPQIPGDLRLTRDQIGVTAVVTRDGEEYTCIYPWGIIKVAINVPGKKVGT